MPLRPRSDEILASILDSFEEFVVPELRDPYAVSVGHTIVNLLRHLRLRVELEGPALYEANAELRELLGEIADFASSSGEPALDGVAADVTAAADAAGGTAAGYAPVSRLTEDAIVLRGALNHALRVLQAAPPALAGTGAYIAIRERIRDQIARDLHREAAWIEPAFSGIRR